MRWLVTGAQGQVGQDVTARLRSDRDVTARLRSDLDVPAGSAAAAAPEEVRALGRGDLDITDALAVDAAVAGFAPDVVVNLAAYTAVDAAETDEAAAYAANTVGPAVLAATLARRGGRLIHLSTDYVFDGAANDPYPAGAPTAPQSVYGRTKLGGEEAVRALLPDAGHVVRTAWVYGAGGGNFVTTMVRLERERDTVDVVDDQHGSPTWSADLAAGIVELGRAGGRVPGGIRHCTNAGVTTWFGLARAVFEELGADPGRVHQTRSAAFVRPAPRPAYSVLGSTEWVGAGLTLLPDWRSALRRAFEVDGDRLRGC